MLAGPVRTRWESFNRQLSTFRLAYDITWGAIAKWLSIATELGVGEGTVPVPLCRAPKTYPKSGLELLWFQVRRDQNGMRHRHLFVALTLEPRGGF